MNRLALLSLVACSHVALAQAGNGPTGDLVEPPICSTIRASHFFTPFCAAVDRTDGSGIRDIQLTLVAAMAPVQVGGYAVVSQNYSGLYIPPLIETKPGSFLNITLTDLLPTADAAASMPGHDMAGHTNLHTHGLIVSPQNETNLLGQGDNILVDLAKGGSFSYKIGIPTFLAAGVLDNANPIEHPDGLYWYHPHLHGLAKQQVSGGMGGVISIGRGSDLLVVNGAGGKPDAKQTDALRKKTDVRYLQLKDLQVTTAVSPEKATGSSPAVWNADYDPGFCGTVDLTNISNGYYRQKGAVPGAPAASPLWLFTINGQRYPRISIDAGRNHLWRIANLSATVTYLIELLDKSNPVAFEVVSVDGVVAGSSVAENGSVASVKKNSLLLMPAGRAEILVRNDGTNPGPDRNLVLRTRGLNTGPDGDTWPAVNLAEVHLAKTSPLKSTLVRSLVPASATSKVQAETPAAASALAVSHTPGNACTRSVLKPGEWRRIGLSQDATQFFIASAIASSAGSSDVIPAAIFPMDMDWDKTLHVCVALGETEVWEIDNGAQEMHNFHLHQTKFRLARPDELKKLGLPATAVVDPTGQLAALGVDMPSESVNGATVWHDTLPIPIAATGGSSSPGKIFIVINFKAAEQVGRYVFHCHILEHEDKGMMAPIEVLRSAK